jgi:hypothetical protein
MPLMLSPAAVVPDSKLRLVIIVFSIPRWPSPNVRDSEVLAIIRAFAYLQPVIPTRQAGAHVGL